MKYLTTNERPGVAQATKLAMERRLHMMLMAGFRPAFFDYATCTVHRSRHTDGSPAEVHVLDGLPDEVVVVRSDCGRVLAVKASLMAGFERNGYFFTFAAGLRAAREWGPGEHVPGT